METTARSALRCLSVALVLLGACGTDEERFPEQFAKDWCTELKACDVDRFWDEFYDGTPECRESTADSVASQGFRDDDRVCKWDQELGESCLELMKEASCDDVLNPIWVTSCTAAWDCVTILDR